MKNSFKFIALYMLCFFCLPTAFHQMISVVMNLTGVELGTGMLGALINFLLYAVLAALVFWLFWKPLQKEAKKFTLLGIPKAVMYSVLLLLFEIGISVAAQMIFEHQGPTGNQNVLNAYYRQGPLLIAVSAMIFAPIVEEVLYRWIILGGLKKGMGTFIALAISSLAFGFVHLGGKLDPYALVVYGGLGLGLGFCYIKEDNIIENILVHGFHNAIVLGIMYASGT